MIESEDHERGGWIRASRVADARLRRYVAREPVGFADWGSSPLSWIDMPRPTASLILSCGEAFGGLPRAFAVGLSDSWSLVDLGGPSTSLDIRLTPTGAHELLGVPMPELGGGAVDLADLLGPCVHDLSDQLGEASSWAERFDLAERFLIGRAETGLRSAPKVGWAWRRMLATRGRAAIGDLAAEVGWSHRHLIALFRRQVGLRPKTVARVIRFRHLLERLGAPDTGLAELAFDCGYADQAHLNRDFREFAGTTPTRYLASLPR